MSSQRRKASTGQRAIDPRRAATTPSRTQIFEEARAVLLRELDANLTLPVVARRVATSPRQLQRAFAETAGASFSDYLLELRMSRAAQLLESSDAAVADVARAVGYGTGGQFSRAFARHHGVTPGSYRRSRDGGVPDPPTAPASAAPGVGPTARGTAGARHRIEDQGGVMAQTSQGPAMTEAYDWKGRKVVDSDGDKVGKVDEIYEDTGTGKPEWALVNTGMFGSKSNFVPLSGAKPSGEDVQLGFSKEQIADAPGVEPDGELSEQEEQSLYEHYALDYTAGTGEDRGDGHDVSGSTTDDAMTRSEEEVHVGTRERESGRVRLRKYVVTEEVTKKVPVKREKVKLERESITDENVGKATDGPAISEEEHEVVLHEEEAVVEKRAVPKERVRLGKEVEAGEETVSEEVRKEQIETEGDVKR